MNRFGRHVGILPIVRSGNPRPADGGPSPRWSALEAERVGRPCSGSKTPTCDRSIVDLGHGAGCRHRRRPGRGGGCARPCRATPPGRAHPAHRRRRGPRPGIDRIDVDLRDMPTRTSCEGLAKNPLKGRRRGGRAPRRTRSQPHPRARDRVGQGRSREVVGHHQPSIALAQRGHEVAAVDADVWGFSMPRMLGVDRAARRDPRRDRAARGQRRPAHLHGLLRQRGPGGRSGAARCCTRRSSSSSPTSTGARSTTW